MAVVAYDNEISQAMNYAFRCLSQRDYSAGKLREKLFGRGYSEECIDQVMRRLERSSYIDDERYARMIVKYYQNKYGKKYIQSILKSKCISQEIASSVLDDISVENELIMARVILEKELHKSQNTILSSQDMYRISQKLVRKLISRGLELNLAYEIVKSTISEHCSVD